MYVGVSVGVYLCSLVSMWGAGWRERYLNYKVVIITSPMCSAVK